MQEGNMRYQSVSAAAEDKLMEFHLWKKRQSQCRLKFPSQMKTHSGEKCIEKFHWTISIPCFWNIIDGIACTYGINRNMQQDSVLISNTFHKFSWLLLVSIGFYFLLFYWLLLPLLLLLLLPLLSNFTIEQKENAQRGKVFRKSFPKWFLLFSVRTGTKGRTFVKSNKIEKNWNRVLSIHRLDPFWQT